MAITSERIIGAVLPNLSFFIMVEPEKSHPPRLFVVNSFPIWLDGPGVVQNAEEMKSYFDEMDVRLIEVEPDLRGFSELEFEMELAASFAQGLKESELEISELAVVNDQISVSWRSEDDQEKIREYEIDSPTDERRSKRNSYPLRNPRPLNTGENQAPLE